MYGKDKRGSVAVITCNPKSQRDLFPYIKYKDLAETLIG